MENTYYSIWIEAIKVIWALELSKGHQTQISWGTPKLPFLPGIMQSQCSNKKQMALTHRAAYLEPAENTLIQCCCWLRATSDQEPGCFHQWVGAAGVEWTVEVWCTSGRKSCCSKLSLLSLLKRIYSNKKLHLGPEHCFQPFPSLLFSHSPLFIAHETSAAAFP